ncbi:MAG: 23S rRNA (guanosine(2251)-2'-O)-methyltransferase RlmB, partial [Tumebacillaceae bacterium]
RPGLIIVLDEIEDPHNLGSILRTADGVGAHGVVIPKRRAVPLTATVAKASAGAIEHMPVARVANISQAIETLKKAGFWVVGTEVETDKMYHQVDMTGPTVIVIGNEGKGLGEVIKKRCDYLVRLPMIGQVQSLNAGVATGILLYEVLRQRGEKR